MYDISNGIISIKVSGHGAELCSIECGGREYLWQADPEFWGRHSPVLFPVVGMVCDKKYRSHGREFTLGQHGFARDMDFELVSRSEDSIFFRLCSSEATKEKYPYDFSLEIGYRLVGRCIKVMWKVTDTSDEETLYYQIGAHPAFHWPMLSDEAIITGTNAMKAELALSGNRGWLKLGDCGRTLTCSRLVSGGVVDPALTYGMNTDPDGFVPVDTSSFDNDAWIFEDSQLSSVTLCREDKSPYLTLKFDTPVVGIWSSPGKNAPFICIEPWYGRTDKAGYTGMYEDKEWIQKLDPGKSHSMEYSIEL